MTDKEKLQKLIEKIEQVVPYVAATLSPHNGFRIKEIEGRFKGNVKDWKAVHAGRSFSSYDQLENLLRTAREMKLHGQVEEATRPGEEMESSSTDKA